MKGPTLHTAAETIAWQLFDGTTWKTPETGVTMHELISRHDGVIFHREGRSSDEWKAVFPDESVITACGGAWDIGYLDCWCWAGYGHENCAHAAPLDSGESLD